MWRSRRRALRPGKAISTGDLTFAACAVRLRNKGSRDAYLSNTPNVLVPVLFAESEIFVQPKAHVVAIETVGSEAQVQQVLFECCCDGRLSRCRQTSEPDGEARLLAVCVALGARERWVPGDVAVDVQYVCLRLGSRSSAMVGFLAGYSRCHCAGLGRNLGVNGIEDQSGLNEK